MSYTGNNAEERAFHSRTYSFFSRFAKGLFKWNSFYLSSESELLIRTRVLGSAGFPEEEHKTLFMVSLRWPDGPARSDLIFSNDVI